MGLEGLGSLFVLDWCDRSKVPRFRPPRKRKMPCDEMFTSPQQRWAYSQFRPTPFRHLDRGPGGVKRGLKKALGDRALRTELDAQTEEFGPVRPDWRAEDPSRRAIRVTGQAGDIRGGNLIGRPASGNNAAAGLSIDFE